MIMDNHCEISYHQQLIIRLFAIFLIAFSLSGCTNGSDKSDKNNSLNMSVPVIDFTLIDAYLESPV